MAAGTCSASRRDRMTHLWGTPATAVCPLSELHGEAVRLLMSQPGAVLTPAGKVMIAPAKPKQLEPHGGLSFDLSVVATQHRHKCPCDTCPAGRSPPVRWLVSQTRCQRVLDRRRWPCGRCLLGLAGAGDAPPAGRQTVREQLQKQLGPDSFWRAVRRQLPAALTGRTPVCRVGRNGPDRSIPMRSRRPKLPKSRLTISRPRRVAWYGARESAG